MEAFTRRSFLTHRNLVNSIVAKNEANGRCQCGYVYSVRTRRVSVGYGRIAYSA
ncbi:MAG: hypothetical protein NC207_00390 [Bacteroides sp.]|nr:hypothetical protein [Bacteroides sp.]